MKIVAILFAFPAKDATIAAVKAAKDKPFKPAGSSVSNAGYALFGSCAPVEVNKLEESIAPKFLLTM
ncbi:hypothetical protein D3C87_1644850 [compost metagenome]